MSEKQAKRLRRMEKDVENIRDGLKEATCGAYEQEVRLSDAESGLKDQDARLKKLEGGLDSFQRYLLETKDHAALKAQDERWTAVRRAIDAEQAVRIWKAVCAGTIAAAALTILMSALAINARGESVQPEQTLPPEPPAIVRTIQAVQNAPDAPEENENNALKPHCWPAPISWRTSALLITTPIACGAAAKLTALPQVACRRRLTSARPWTRR